MDPYPILTHLKWRNYCLGDVQVRQGDIFNFLNLSLKETFLLYYFLWSCQGYLNHVISGCIAPGYIINI